MAFFRSNVVNTLVWVGVVFGFALIVNYALRPVEVLESRAPQTTGVAAPVAPIMPPSGKSPDFIIVSADYYGGGSEKTLTRIVGSLTRYGDFDKALEYINHKKNRGDKNAMRFSLFSEPLTVKQIEKLMGEITDPILKSRAMAALAQRTPSEFYYRQKSQQTTEPEPAPSALNNRAQLCSCCFGVGS